MSSSRFTFIGALFTALTSASAFIAHSSAYGSPCDKIFSGDTQAKATQAKATQPKATQPKAMPSKATQSMVSEAREKVALLEKLGWNQVDADADADADANELLTKRIRIYGTGLEGVTLLERIDSSRGKPEVRAQTAAQTASQSVDIMLTEAQTSMTIAQFLDDLEQMARIVVPGGQIRIYNLAYPAIPIILEHAMARLGDRLSAQAEILRTSSLVVGGHPTVVLKVKPH